jgi:hypothetical protein
LAIPALGSLGLGGLSAAALRARAKLRFLSTNL